MDRKHALALVSSVFSLAFFGCGAAAENIESETETLEIENAAHTGGLGFHVWTTIPGGGCSMIGADVSLGVLAPAVTLRAGAAMTSIS